MPKYDGTGPSGAGPGIGRRMGYCCGPWGCGIGWGSRFGKGLGGRFALGGGLSCWDCPMCGLFGPADKKQQKDYLKKYKEFLMDELKKIENEVSYLDKDE